jgi:hypothetical protein
LWALAALFGFAAWAFLSILWGDDKEIAWYGGNRALHCAVEVALFSLPAWPSRSVAQTMGLYFLASEAAFDSLPGTSKPPPVSSEVWSLAKGSAAITTDSQASLIARRWRPRRLASLAVASRIVAVTGWLARRDAHDDARDPGLM